MRFLKIRNPGLLYGGLTIEKIKTEMVSERRNELLADMLHRIHFIEKWGRGISLMLSKEPQTQLKEVGNHFIVVFKRKGIEEKVPEKVTRKTREKTREKILRAIKENSYVTTDELARATGITLKGIEWNLKKLKEEGVLRRIGPDKGGYWMVIT